eukprot:12819005-Heterocapsa_arctica.AAC.1
MTVAKGKRACHCAAAASCQWVSCRHTTRPALSWLTMVLRFAAALAVWGLRSHRTVQLTKWVPARRGASLRRARSSPTVTPPKR